MGWLCRMVLHSHRTWVLLGPLQSLPFTFVSQYSHSAHSFTLLVGPYKTWISEPCFSVRMCWPWNRLRVPPVSDALGDERNLSECPFLAPSPLVLRAVAYRGRAESTILGLGTGSRSRVGLTWFYVTQGQLAWQMDTSTRARLAY